MEHRIQQSPGREDRMLFHRKSCKFKQYKTLRRKDKLASIIFTFSKVIFDNHIKLYVIIIIQCYTLSHLYTTDAASFIVGLTQSI